MADDRGNGLVSIVMPCCGQLEQARLSVPRLLQHSRRPCEVWFVDAGSLDGVREFLLGVRAAAPVRVEVLHSNEEAAFAELVRETLARLRGAFVAWIHNDVLVTEVWLQQLLALVQAGPQIGVVGPMANLAAAQQRVEKVPYRLGVLGRDGELDTQAVDHFATEHRQAQRGKWAEVEQLGGFCWLARRDVLSRVEVLEPGTEQADLDEARFSARVRQAGYSLACCRDLYVHHFGTRLLRGSGA